MELVYLWVEEYKNIKEQGFNFSPRFDCKYDKDSNELTIDEKEDYVSIFPENINVTAIVGENGSGKSSIFELITLSNFPTQYTNVILNNKSFFIVFYNKYRNIFMKKLFNFDGTINYKGEKKSLIIDKYDYTFYFSNKISTFFDKPNFSFFQTYANFNANEIYSTQEKNRNYHPDLDTKDNLNIFAKIYKTLLQEDKNLFTYTSKQYQFNKYKHELHFYEVDSHIKETFNLNVYDIINFETPYNGEDLYKYIILIILKDTNIKKLSTNINRKLRKKDFNKNDYIELLIEIKKSKNINSCFNVENVIDIIDNYSSNVFNIWEENISHDISEDIIFNNPLLEKLNDEYIRTNFYFNDNDEHNFLALSSGEKEYLFLLVKFIWKLKERKEQEIFIFDEIELGLHPNWQKRLIKDILFYIKKLNQNNLHLIFASHSPYLLSDIPKENVIFLKDGKVGIPNINQTFGANIHTLLSNGFFMQNGLMGEFAKEKINEVIEILKKDELTDNEIKTCKHIISIIGEPILQKTLQNQLDTKIFSNETELQRLEREQEELEEKIKKLKEQNNETN